MSNILWKLCLITFCMFAINLVAEAQPIAIPHGEYQNTCEKEGIFMMNNNYIFVATCKGKGGAEYKTSYSSSEYPGDGWQNINGNLYLPGKVPGGSWRDSCHGSQYGPAFEMPGIFPDTLKPQYFLQADCEGNGSFHTSSIQASPEELFKNVHGELKKEN